jgi:hypothetical protein
MEIISTLKCFLKEEKGKVLIEYIMLSGSIIIGSVIISALLLNVGNNAAAKPDMISEIGGGFGGGGGGT